MPETDNNCIRFCTNGHPDAYRVLVRRYQAPLISYLVGRLGNLDRAEEAAQESFVRAFFALQKLKVAKSFFSWLLGIANRVAQEQRRAERRHREALNQLPPRAQTPAPEHDYALEQALAELPARHAEVILLRYYGELPCAEVAARLDIPLGTVTKRLSQAYALLRESLREDADQPKSAKV